MQPTLTILHHKSEMTQILETLAQMRIRNYAEFPYLYDGDLEYEKHYLTQIIESKGAAVIIMKTENQVIGYTSGMPMLSDAEIIESFSQLENASKIFYVTDVILDQQHRKNGLGRMLLKEMECYALKSGYSTSSFLTVDREEDDPRRPKMYKSPDHIWESCGYHRTKMKCFFPWKTFDENGASEEQMNPMSLWLKSLDS